MAKRSVTRKKGKRKAKRSVTRSKGKGRRKSKRYPLSSTTRAWIVARDGRGHLTGIAKVSPSTAKAHIKG